MPNLKTTTQIDWNYEVFGEGEERILFLHGWGVDHRIWKQQTKYFEEQYQVIAVDLPGHGKTSFQQVSFYEMAHDLREVFIQADFGKCAVVGSSLGGLLALKMYEQFPNLFTKMTFVGSMPRFAKSEEYPYGLDVSAIRHLDQQVNTHYPKVVDVFFRSLFTEEERKTRRYKWLMKFREFDEKPMKEALKKYLDIFEHEDLREVLKSVSVPLQFINGDGDGITTPETVEYIQTLVPHARFDMFEGSGHFPFLINPYQFNDTLEEFLKWSV